MQDMKMTGHETAGQQDIILVITEITLQCIAQFFSTNNVRTQVKLYIITE